MINNERPKLEIKALRRGRVSRESNAESSQSHRINTPADSDAYRQSETSEEKKRGENTNSGLLVYRHRVDILDP